MIGMLLVSCLFLFYVLGFAFIVWCFAGKEAGMLKIAGQVIAVIIAVLVIVLFIYGGMKGGRMGKGMCPMCKPGHSCMMHSGDKAKMMKMHDKMMKMDEKGMKCKETEKK